MSQRKGPKLADCEAWGKTEVQEDECDLNKSYISWFTIVPGILGTWLAKPEVIGEALNTLPYYQPTLKRLNRNHFTFICYG